jgi:hypothetical protein
MKQTELQQMLGERITNLSRNDMTDEEFVREIERSKAMASLAKEMVRNAGLIIAARKSVGSLNTELVNSMV